MNPASRHSVGESFNPRYEVCGFHPEEIVSRQRGLTSSQKLLYSRLVRWARNHDGNRSNERAGEVWRSHENMAAAVESQLARYDATSFVWNRSD